MVAHHVLVPQLTERLRDAENDSMAKIAELEKQLSQARKELETLRVSCGCGLGPGWGVSRARLPKKSSPLDIPVYPRRGLGRGCSMPESLRVGTEPSPGACRSVSANRPPWALPDVSLSLRKCLPLLWCDDPQL